MAAHPTLTLKPMPRKPSKPKPAPGQMLDFTALVESINRVHDQSAAAVNRVLNTSLTLRNWVIGLYLAEYELRGADRAEYGDRALGVIANRLTDMRVSNYNRRQLYRNLRFFRFYPGIVGTLSPQSPLLLSKEVTGEI